MILSNDDLICDYCGYFGNGGFRIIHNYKKRTFCVICLKCQSRLDKIIKRENIHYILPKNLGKKRIKVQEDEKKWKM